MEVMIVPSNEQWKDEGEGVCTQCRRQPYCKKQCTFNRQRMKRIGTAIYEKLGPAFAARNLRMTQSDLNAVNDYVAHAAIKTDMYSSFDIREEQNVIKDMAKYVGADKQNDTTEEVPEQSES